MKQQTVSADVTVIGGGLAGVCASIAAARLGQTVALVQNRPVLGGNSSSEVRVWVSSATAHGTQRYARETGIMGELFLENEWTNPEGNPYLWDLVMLEAVRREANITLFLNTDVRSLEMDSPERIRSVSGWQMGAELDLTFESPLFLDCTGDGLVGFLAGADHVLGREAKATYGEDWAPDVADDFTLGSTILFYTKDAGRPVPFVAPSFAIDISGTSIPEKRIIRSGDNGCHYWWIEWGGELDTVHDNERIRDELWGIVYGIWDFIKNSGQFPESSDMTLEWVGSLPGKRESRRFLGDYVLRQQDILDQREFEDAVAFGGWSIDLHPPQGVFSYETGSRHLYSDGVYQIPYRCLYSRNVGNLLFAGRNISASHVAFGSTRVMGTCAAMGEAAGTAAALCAARGISPRALYQDHRRELVQTLLRLDGPVIAQPRDDDRDLARQATIRASSQQPGVTLTDAASVRSLDADLGILVPVDGALDFAELLLDVAASTVLTVEVWDTSKPQNAVPHRHLASTEVALEAGERQWVRAAFGLHGLERCNLFLVIRAAQGVGIHLSPGPLAGVLGFQRTSAASSGDPNEGVSDQLLRVWSEQPLHRTPPCLRLADAPAVYSPENVVNPWARPYGGPNTWVSAPLDADPAPWIELRWNEPVALREVLLTFDDDVNEDVINLHHHRLPWRVIPELVRDYSLEVCSPEGWQVVEQVRDNRRRRRTHTLGGNEISAIRIVVQATNGAPSARLIQVSAYES